LEGDVVVGELVGLEEGETDGPLLGDEVEVVGLDVGEKQN